MMESIVMSNTATLSTTSRITIPEAVRVTQGWSAGQEFAFIIKNKGVLLIPVPDREELRGLAAGANPENFRDRSERA